MKRITNWIKKTAAKAIKWVKNELLTYKRWFIKIITINAFRIAVWSKKHAQANYDANVMSMIKGLSTDNYEHEVVRLYQFVRRKQAFVFKTKIMSAGKGIKHFKVLLVETPAGIIEVQVALEGTEDYTKHDYVNKPDDGK